MFSVSESASVRDLRRSRQKRRPSLRQSHPQAARANRALSDLGEQLFIHSRDAIVVEDLYSGRILRWNPAAQQLFGHPSSRVIGQPVDALLVPAVARLHRERVAQYMRCAEPEVLSGRGPVSVPVLNAFGNELCAELSVAPLDAQSGHARSLVLFFRDRSCVERAQPQARADTENERRRCQELLVTTPRQLQPSLTRARRSAARLVRMVRRNGDARPQRLAALAHVVERRTEQLQQQLDQMTDAAAIEAGAFEMLRERTNLVPLVASVIAEQRQRSSSHRVNFGAPQGLTAICDPRRITMVVEDLLARSMRRNPRGCWIDVDLRRPLAGTAQIEVRDYGRSPSAGERDALLSATGGDQAWFVDRYIVEQHGGTLEVAFPPEGGVRATINLPTRRG